MCAFDWSIQTASRRRTGKHGRFETAISAHTDSVNLYPSLSSVKENGSKCLLSSLSCYIILTVCDGRKGGSESGLLVVVLASTCITSVMQELNLIRVTWAQSICLSACYGCGGSLCKLACVAISQSESCDVTSQFNCIA